MTVLGKNVIENLTIGMYEDSRFIYREYVQNSADQIDKAIKNGLLKKEEAIIDIEIDDLKRNIKIYDNATGIESVKFKDTLSDIANSNKDRNQDKGFRGIGRLGGLAYCDKLVFRSSYLGENIESIMIWDAKLCKEIIEDSNKKCTAEELINKIISFEEKECELDTHFFEVEMINVHKESKKLLNIEDIKNYLSFIAPVPFVNSFRLRTKIYEYVKENNLVIDEYCIKINGEQLFKQYKMDLYNKESKSKGKEVYDVIYDIYFHEFINDNNELLAWMWIGVSRFEKQIPKNNLSRGIRLRKGNIGIGGDNTLAQHHLFNENRANYYFIGEVHAIHNELIPNARRDYFNENKYREEFEELLSKKFQKELESMYKEASEVRSAYRKKSEYKKIKQDFNEKKEKGLFLDENELNKNELKVEEAEKNAKKSEQEIIKRKYKYDGNKVFENIFEHIEKKYSSNENIDKSIENKSNDDNNKGKKKKKQMFASNIPGYSKKEKKLLERVFKTITSLLPPNEANELISKIKEELMHNE